jgi:DNA-binding response OmpR family regulator
MRASERNITILLASLDPTLTKLRKGVLEVAGYRVIVVDTVAQIASECRNHAIDLVLIGSSLPAAEKRKFLAEFRQHCSSVVLELYSDGTPELMDDVRTYVHHPVTSVDFVEAVQAILAQG